MRATDSARARARARARERERASEHERKQAEGREERREGERPSLRVLNPTDFGRSKLHQFCPYAKKNSLSLSLGGALVDVNVLKNQPPSHSIQ